jgi:catechol 2,3-dioxygenase-like lactoylglutathione lyase family enzyme
MRVLLLLVAAMGMWAQLAPPNEAGVTMGHVHLYVGDVAAHQRFFTEMLGGTLVKNEKLEMVALPGVYIILRQAEPAGPPEGSIVNHFGFVWRDLQPWLAKWRAAGLKIEQAENPNQGYVSLPGAASDGIRVEFFGDTALTVPVQMNHIHYWPKQAEIPAIQAWYAKTFGGIAGKRQRVSRPGLTDCVDLPGVNLSYSPVESSSPDRPNMVPTAGRSLEHIGFEVRRLPEFLKRVEAMGVKIVEPLRASQFSSKLQVAFIVDPWGTKIELTEGLAP